MKVSKYSIGTSWFTSKGSNLRKMLPTTRTRLNTTIAKSTLTSNSRLTNRSINFILNVLLIRIVKCRMVSKRLQFGLQYDDFVSVEGAALQQRVRRHLRRRHHRRRTGRQHRGNAAGARRAQRDYFRARKVSPLSYRRIASAVQHESIH